jgi:hypothetical protein
MPDGLTPIRHSLACKVSAHKPGTRKRHRLDLRSQIHCRCGCGAVIRWSRPALSKACD